MIEVPPWPALPDDLGNSSSEQSLEYRAKLALFQASIDDVAAERAAIRANAERKASNNQSMMDVEDRRRDAFLAAYLEVTKATLDRMLKRAETLTTVTAAVATIYGGILGVAFSLKDGVPLPWVGIVPAVLLGLSLVCVAISLIPPSQGKIEGRALAAGLGPKADQKRINTFVTWVNVAATERARALTASVILLGVGMICLPLPFLV